MGRKLIYIIGIVVALVAVGVGSFYGGTVYAAQQASSARAAFLNGRGGTGGGGGFGGGVAGTIKSINGNTIVLSTAQSEVTVTVSDSTQVMRLTVGKLSDLKVGDRISVRGTRDASGNLAATVIQPLGSRGGGQPTPTAAP